MHHAFQIWLSERVAQKTVNNYITAIQGSLSGWAREAGFITDTLFDIYEIKHFNEVAVSIEKLDIFQHRNIKGKGMYSAALNKYRLFLDEKPKTSLWDDIPKINEDSSLEETEKQILSAARMGQGKFRKSLLDYWGGCAVTGYKNTPFLVASHIKPWKDANNTERLDVYNGLLLLPNLDKAFDKGFIGFESNGQICLSKRLENPEVLNICKNLSINLEKQHQLYITYHREQVFH